MTNLESNNSDGRNLSQRQCAAIKRSIDFGRILVEEHPEIADLYKRGNTQEKIAEMLDLKSKYGHSNSVTRVGVLKALSGYEGGFGLSEYEGLIPDSEERSQLALEHMVEFGFKTLREKTGVFGRTSEKRTEDAIKSVVSRGQTPWKKQGDHLGNEIYCAIDELDYAHHLAQQPEFQEKGKMKRNKVKQIANELNKSYHQGELVRTPDTITTMLLEHKKANGFIPQTQNLWKKQGDHLGNEIYCAIAETDYAYHLAQQPEFKSGKTRAKTKQIAIELNKLYHQGESVRTSGKVIDLLGRIRESLGIERKKRVNLKKQGDHLGNGIYCAIAELDYAHHLAQQPEFTYAGGRNNGRKRSQDIANELNKLYHQGELVRSADSITSMLSPSKRL